MKRKNPDSRAEEPTMGRRGGRLGREIEELDPALCQALSDFRASVHAWSEDAYVRARPADTAAGRRSRRLALCLSLASVLLAGVIGGGILRDRQAAEARAAQALEQEHTRQLALERSEEGADPEEQILAGVDRAVSREVPAAMEPLAAMGDEWSEGTE